MVAHNPNTRNTKNTLTHTHKISLFNMGLCFVAVGFCCFWVVLTF